MDQAELLFDVLLRLGELVTAITALTLAVSVGFAIVALVILVAGKR